MRNLPIAGSRDVVPEEMETNADGINTSNDAPAEVKGTLSLRAEIQLSVRVRAIQWLTLLRLLRARIRGSTD